MGWFGGFSHYFWKHLYSWWFQPIWKNTDQFGSFLHVEGEHQKILETTTSARPFRAHLLHQPLTASGGLRFQTYPQMTNPFLNTPTPLCVNFHISSNQNFLKSSAILGVIIRYSRLKYPLHPRSLTARPWNPLKNDGWKTSLSYWVSVTFQGRTVKLWGGTTFCTWMSQEVSKWFVNGL